jgi:hypothetical protein
MNYSKEYLEEQSKFNPLSLALGPLGALIGAGIGSASDVVGTFLRPPLDLAKAIGHEQRMNQLKRVGTQKFGSTQSALEAAIEASLGSQKENLLNKLGQRGGNLLTNLQMGRLFGRR